MFLELIYSISIDCPDVINLAKGMNMHLVQPLMFINLTNYDCCSSVFNKGLSCSANRVVTISWPSLILNGTLNASAIPPLVNYFYIGENSNTGPIEAIPANITFFNVFYNSFSGPMPPLPPNLKTLQLSGNSLTGSVPNLPSGLTYFNVANNKMNGTVSEAPTKLLTYSLPYNFFTGILISIPPIVIDYQVQANLFKGYIPSAPSTVTTFMIGDGNLFCGSITLNRPTVVDIRGTLITDIFFNSTRLYWVFVFCPLHHYLEKWII